MKEDKIGPDVISLMTDEDISQYLPIYGDRVRLRDYAKSFNCSAKKESKKTKLLTILRKKLDQKAKTRSRSSSPEETMGNGDKLRGNRNAVKETRKVELGWVHVSGNQRKQMRVKQAGGTRKVTIKKNAIKVDLLNEGKQLFFPEGRSSKGLISDFDHDILDFSERVIDSNQTIGDMYEETKMPMLRFYFTTKEKHGDTSELSDQDDLPDMSLTSQPSTSHSSAPTTQATREHRPTQEAAADSTNLTRPEAIMHAPIRVADTEQAELFLPISVASSDDYLPELHNPINESLAQYGTSAYDINRDMVDSPMSNTRPISQDLVSAAMDIAEIEVPQDCNIDRLETGVVQEHIIKLHRGQVMKEMIKAFRDVNPYKDLVTVQMIDPSGKMETAEDGGGVTRDAISEFWKDFYELCTDGLAFKVPVLRHDFGIGQWNAVAKIIVFGWKVSGYFPVQISLPFLQHCLFGYVTCDMKDEFLKYIPENDAVILNRALAEDSVDPDDLLDVLQEHEVKTVVRPDNLLQVIQEVAHKELVQAGMFIINCWSPVLSDIRITMDKLNSLHMEVFPTPKRVLSVLRFPENITVEESAVANHLRRFIRGLDNTNLLKFLRYCTGSDLLICPKIDVAFVNVSGFSRRPVAHTCSCLLELSKSYENFPEFRAEFQSVLNADMWTMDII